MARPPHASDSVLKYGITYDVYDYPAGADGRYLALWINAHIDGPVVGKEAAAWPNERSWDRLVFENRTLFTDKEWSQLDRRLDAGQQVRIPMYDLFFSTDFPPADREGNGHGDNLIDLHGETVTTVLSKNSYQQIDAQVDLVVDSWVDYGMDLFLRRMREPAVVPHWEHRMWNVACLLCPELAQAVETRINMARSEHCHAEMEMLLAPRDPWLLVKPNKPHQRQDILRALAKDNSVFTKAQIAIILAYTNPDAEETMTLGDGEEVFFYRPAKDVTIDHLLKAARLSPIYSKYYCARQITHELLPFALARYKAQQRYKDIAEELTEFGITIPPMPVVQQV